MSSSNIVSVRYDFCLIFDAKNCNPNGDPDNNNSPRIDHETNHGLIMDVCLKRKIRNYVSKDKGSQPGFDIFISDKSVLNNKIESAVKDLGLDLQLPPKNSTDKKRNKPGKSQGNETDQIKNHMCKSYYDIRTFGAVLSTGPNGGQVRGPVSMSLSTSFDKISPIEHSITVCAVRTEGEAERQGGENHTFGNKHTVPYGMYQCFGSISANFAEQSGFTEQDLDLFFEACERMFFDDASASRPAGSMTMQKVVIFKHKTKYGDIALSNLIKNFINVKLKDNVSVPRNYDDYNVIINNVENNDIKIIINL